MAPGAPAAGAPGRPLERKATGSFGRARASTEVQEKLKTISKSFASPSTMACIAGSILAACAGCVNAVAFLQLGTFVSHVTGSVSRIGIHLQGSHHGRDTLDQMVEAIGLVFAFLAGAMLCGLLVHRREMSFGRAWYGMALLFNSLFLIIAVMVAETEAVKYLAAAACGLQNGLCTMHFGAIVRTTHVTGLTTDLGTTIGRLLVLLGKRLRNGFTIFDERAMQVEFKKVRVFLHLIVGFFVGSIIGAYLEWYCGIYAFLMPATVTMVCGALYSMSNSSGQLQNVANASIEREVDDILTATRKALGSAAEQGGEDSERLTQYAFSLARGKMQVRIEQRENANGDHEEVLYLSLPATERVPSTKCRSARGDSANLETSASGREQAVGQTFGRPTLLRPPSSTGPPARGDCVKPETSALPEDRPREQAPRHTPRVRDASGLSVLQDHANGCGFEFDAKAAQKSGRFRKDDPLQEHYKKTGVLGAITGAFGDKKTMYCHHLTISGMPAVRAAQQAGVRPRTAEEVWDFLGKRPCCGRFLLKPGSGRLVCEGVSRGDHDNTCNPETCLFVASGLECPTPAEAHKK